MIFAALIAIVFGFFYGILLNRIKGDEMLIATYVGYSFTAFMCIAYLILPYKNPVSVLSYSGRGLSQQVPVADYWMKSKVLENGTKITEGLLNNFLSISILGVRIPVGMFLIFALMAFIVWAFFKTKTGTAMTAVGSNPEYARASGININRVRLVSVILQYLLQLELLSTNNPMVLSNFTKRHLPSPFKQ